MALPTAFRLWLCHSPNAMELLVRGSLDMCRIPFAIGLWGGKVGKIENHAVERIHMTIHPQHYVGDPLVSTCISLLLSSRYL